MGKPIQDMERDLREAEAWRDEQYSQLAVTVREVECKRAALFIARAKLAEPDKEAA